MPVHLHTHQHPHWLFSTATHKPYHQFCIPNFEPVTPSPSYFGAPLYQSLKFNRITHKWQEWHELDAVISYTKIELQITMPPWQGERT